MSLLLRKISFCVFTLAIYLAVQADATAMWPQPGGLGTPITLTYSYQNMFDDGNPTTPNLLDPNGVLLPDLLIRNSIEEALGLWAEYAPLHFVEVEDVGLGGTIRFKLGRIDGREPELGTPRAKAMARFPGTGSLAGDVTFDYEDRWQKVGTLRQPDILGAAVHELGHSLGLSHSVGTIPGEFWTYPESDGAGGIRIAQEPMGDAVMFWIFPRFTGPGSGTLFPDDINRIQGLYGAGMGSVTPLLRVPEPASLTITLTMLVMLRTLFVRRSQRLRS